MAGSADDVPADKASSGKAGSAGDVPERPVQASSGMAGSAEDVPADKASLRVLFLHGLEGGLESAKPNYLRRNFDDVACPHMHMSLLGLGQENSIARSLLRQTTRSLPWHWPSAAAEDSLTRCLNIQRNAIAEFKPDILVGSSWGGGVSLLCLSEGLWTGPTLVIAPALRKVLETAGEGSYVWKDVEGRLAAAASRLTLVHGAEDSTVPIEHSKDLAAAISCEFIPIEGGDHSLNKALLHGRLRELILQRYRGGSS